MRSDQAALKAQTDARFGTVQQVLTTLNSAATYPPGTVLHQPAPPTGPHPADLSTLTGDDDAIPSGPKDHWPTTNARLEQCFRLVDSITEICALSGNQHAHLLNARSPPMSLHSTPSTPNNPFNPFGVTPPARATQMPLSKAVHPPKFDGDVVDFFDRAEMYYALTGTPAHQWIPIALLSIPTRNVSKRWFAHATTHPAKVTWADFKEQISIFARGHSVRSRALASLSHCTQQTDTVDKYITRYATLVSTASEDCAAPHIIQGFLRGMTDATLRTMLTHAPDGSAWTSLLALQNQASILAVSRYPTDPAPARTPAQTNKRKFTAGRKDYTFDPASKQYGTTKAQRSLYHLKDAINALSGELKEPGKFEAARQAAANRNGGRGRGDAGRNGARGGGRGTGGGRFSGYGKRKFDQN
jgi:hypothetical protein